MKLRLTPKKCPKSIFLKWPKTRFEGLKRPDFGLSQLFLSATQIPPLMSNWPFSTFDHFHRVSSRKLSSSKSMGTYSQKPKIAFSRLRESVSSSIFRKSDVVFVQNPTTYAQFDPLIYFWGTRFRSNEATKSRF